MPLPSEPLRLQPRNLIEVHGVFGRVVLVDRFRLGSWIDPAIHSAVAPEWPGRV